MIIVDIFENIKKTGVFSTWLGLADLHFLVDTEDENAYQPLDYDAYNYLKYCAEELKDNPNIYGKVYTYGGGDWTELYRSTIRKMKSGYHKNDTRAEDSLHKKVLNDYVLRMKHLTKGTTFVGGVAGNHLIEFSQESTGTGYANSDDYLIKRLGGKYCGEGMMMINYHINLNGQKLLKKILIMHGTKGGTKQSIIRELQTLHSMFGKIDAVVVGHAHDPMTAFYCRYNTPDRADGKIKKHETLVMCLGATRDGVKKGYDDYCERFMYTPSAGRFAMFKAMKTSKNNSTLEVKIRPLTI